jgi:cbb3-type cytochrome oxidase subunit 3
MKGLLAFITVLFVMPLGHAATVLVLKLPHAWHLPMAAGGVLAAVIIIYLTKYIASPGRETCVGMLAGVLLWAALVEIGVHEGADAINITERKAMEFSLAILIPLLIYFVFNENLKCNLFVELRKRLHTSRNTAPEIAIDHWGPRVAVKMFLMIWIGHLILFFGYDEDFFGPQGIFCKMVFVVCLLGGSYLFYRLTKAGEMDCAFRYAMPTVVVLWSCVELLVKWKIFSEPWITLNPLFLAVVALVFIALIIFIMRSERRKKAV